MVRGKRIAYIFGSGSIACRHSRILSSFNFAVYCVSQRLNSSYDIFHQNSFQAVIHFEELKVNDECICIIANNTSEHTDTYKTLIKLGFQSKQIFCEKPGPSESIRCQLLYNLEFMNLKRPFIGAPIKLVHCADARMWPANRHWSERYIFRKVLGGGCLNTHSHEVHHAFKINQCNKIDIISTKKYTDNDGQNINSALECMVGETKIVLDILSDSPVRFWEYEDVVFKFYGDAVSCSSAKEIYEISSDEIELSYFNMWRHVLFEDGDLYENNWLSEYDN